MKIKAWQQSLVCGLFILSMVFSSTCSSVSFPPTSTSPITSIPSTTSPSPSAIFSQYQLEYLLLNKYPDYFWCDPDSYPIGISTDQQMVKALTEFPNINANSVEFNAILEHLGLPFKNDYTDTEILNIYQEDKLLKRAVQMTLSSSSYLFILHTGRDQGSRLEGTITFSGTINLVSQTVSFNTCPICLAGGTLISTPGGIIPVEQIQPGILVYSLDAAGMRTSQTVIKTSSTRVPASFQVVKIRLSDGRSVTASPGHPSADLKALNVYKAGDGLDGAIIIDVEMVYYDGGSTYDLLPAGPSSLYWANGILLRSTLTAP
jgi:hypothetical protein